VEYSFESLEDVGVSVSPESLPMKMGGGKPIRYEINTLHALTG